MFFSPEHTQKWDKGLTNSEIEPLRGASKSCYYAYTCNKSQFGIPSRDFYEKVCAFTHNGKYYRYTSHVPNSEAIGPNGEPIRRNLPTTKTVRGETLINITKIERVPSGEI